MRFVMLQHIASRTRHLFHRDLVAEVERVRRLHFRKSHEANHCPVNASLSNTLALLRPILARGSPW